MEMTMVPGDGAQAERTENQWVLTMALYFDEVRSALWARQALCRLKEISYGLGVEFSHLGVEPLEPRSGDLRAGYAYRWTPKNVGRFEAMISSGNVRSFEVNSVENPKTDYLTHGPFGFLARFVSQDVPSGTVYLQLGPKLLTRWQGGLGEKLYSIVCGFEEIADIRYGYVQPMLLGKAPYIFPIGVGGPLTTRLEDKDNALWRRFAGDYRRQMRNLYWGNVVTHEHCLVPFDKALEGIRGAVSGENVRSLGGDKVFFTLPIDLENIEDRDHCERYHEIRKALEPYLRFMVPDEWVNKIVSALTYAEIITAAQAQSRMQETEEKPENCLDR